MNIKLGSGHLQTRAFDYDVKSVDDAGLFSGYGSVFGVVDTYNEVVAPGAFKNSLAALNDKGRALPVLWQHRTGEPVGNWDMSSLKEDSHGLFGSGELWMDESPYAKVAYRGMKSKSITGLSIGYYVRDSSLDSKTGIRTLKELELVEISIVTNPANDEARVDTIKSKLAHGCLPTLREFEEVLRSMGFSKNDAAIIANRGLLDRLDRGDHGKGGMSGELRAALSGFSLPK